MTGLAIALVAWCGVSVPLALAVGWFMRGAGDAALDSGPAGDRTAYRSEPAQGH